MGFRISAVVLSFALVAFCQQREAERPVRRPARGLRGAIATGGMPASEAGMRLFHAGGNAVDAGVAATLAAAVTEFSHFGFGGEAPILIRDRSGRVVVIPGLGPMPRAATAELFRNRKPEPGMGPGAIVPVAGLLPALVPGMVDGILVALREHGTKPFAEAAAPALELARGMVMDEARSIAIRRSAQFLELWPDSRRVFMPDGRVPRPGEIFRQPDLARTIEAMIAAERTALTSGASRAAALDAVRDLFYRGDIARRIDAFSRARGGLLRYEDMARFRITPEKPVAADYRGYEIYKPGFWTQGPALIEALNILERFDLRRMGRNSAEYIHTSVEALKLAYADRDTWYGDPAFADVPAAALISKRYAEARLKLIGEQASLDFRPGAPDGRTGRHPGGSDMMRVHIDDSLMARDTTCVNAIDKDGAVYSATPSGAWLPSVIAGDTGIPLTQRAQSFLLIPGHPNELAGGKRPRITLSPTLVVRDGRPFAALSTPGGDNQDQSLLQVLLNVVEFGMNAEAAVEAPRFQTRHLVSSFDNHAMNPGDLLLDQRIPAGVASALAARGHKVDTRSRWESGAAPVLIRVMPSGAIEAGADPYGYRSAQAW